MEGTSKWWWIGRNHNTSNSSPWLNSTLSELDAKTKEVMRVIDEVDDEADSFVKRAKIYHEKKPELVAMIEDLYRSHRSLAQKHDLLIKTSSLNPSEETESEVDDGEEDQIVVFADDGETMKEELAILGEENRVYKEKRELAWLFTDLVKVPFASVAIGKYFVLFFCAFVYHFLCIL
ncbi:PREDICTED: protein NETWORKED 3B-like [Camelina sativa]|uniref:Protein NETWORKED 3B-like n=1 Tax=Camelina sativa TaxID=90675 RepID=A0ABM0W8J4_CAMSA|nr:PREDICTED: protein NETWORKED 3B-like [Camelina sativa]